MDFNGVLESLNRERASGWVRFPRTVDPVPEDLQVRLLVSGYPVTAAMAFTERPGLTNETHQALGFTLGFQEPLSVLPAPEDVRAAATLGGGEVALRIWRPLSLALGVSSLATADRARFWARLSPEANHDLKHAATGSEHRRPPPGVRRPLAVIAQANGSEGWFPYFYDYYSKAAGPDGIFILTPKPDAFRSYRLGGMIAHPAYDDVSRAQFMQGFSASLQTFFEWTLVCDVDEIVIPHPRLGVGLVEYLATQQDEVLLARGFDVVQMADEADFEFDKPVSAQRRHAIPNSALSKPHASRVPVRYSVGYHYCDRALSFAPHGEGLLTLHLKWACRKIRREVAQLVSQTQYSDPTIRQYSARTVSEDVTHPEFERCLRDLPKDLHGPEMDAFEAEYRNNLTFNGSSSFWGGTHRVAPFFVLLE